jgi:hypothetical protein
VGTLGLALRLRGERERRSWVVVPDKDPPIRNRIVKHFAISIFPNNAVHSIGFAHGLARVLLDLGNPIIERRKLLACFTKSLAEFQEAGKQNNREKKLDTKDHQRNRRLARWGVVIHGMDLLVRWLVVAGKQFTRGG